MKRSIVIKNSHSDEMGCDIYYPENQSKPLPLLIFLHGFKGFKDWGGFPYMLGKISEAGYAAAGFNFSYNGIGDDLVNFTKLDRFADNTATREIEDTISVIDYFEKNAGKLNIDFSSVTLTGHSRGGGAAIITAAEDSRVTRLITLNAVSEFNRFTPERKEEWRKTGYIEMLNSRTKQMMRMNVIYLDDLEKNAERVNVINAASRLRVPFLIIQGAEDLAVNKNEAEMLYEVSDKSKSKLVIIEHTGHTFGTEHPFKGTTPAFEKVINYITGKIV